MAPGGGERSGAGGHLSTVLLGTDEMFDFISFPMGFERCDMHQMSPGTAQLVTKDAEGLKVLWLRVVLETPQKAAELQGVMERELEKRLKARAKK